jgi:hypothetical protein
MSSLFKNSQASVVKSTRMFRFLSRLESGVFVSGGQVSGGEWKVGGSMTSKKIQIKKDKRLIIYSIGSEMKLLTE